MKEKNSPHWLNYEHFPNIFYKLLVMKISFIKLLVIVIFIASIFTIMIYPELGSREKSRRTKAKALTNAIVLAVKSYDDCFGSIPYGKENTKDDLIVNKEYNRLMELLTCKKGPDGGTVHMFNSKGIKFLDTYEGYDEKGYLDPWGNKFIISIDANHDGKIIVAGEEIQGKVIGYSCGKDGKDDKGKNDDICSWKDLGHK